MVKGKLKFLKFKFVVLEILFKNVEFIIDFDVGELVSYKIKGEIGV